MSGVFIRALWGDRQVCLFDMIREECRVIRGKFPHQFDPEVWYCFGEENRDFLRSIGYEPRMISPLPVVPLAEGKARNPWHYGLIVYGKSIWIHKLLAIRKAVEDFGECVWVDADCGLRRPLPSDFWERMRSGPSVRISLFYTVHREASWRDNTADMHYSNMGRWAYWRGVETVDAVLAIAEEFPLEEDQKWTARYIDRLMGGWRGPEAYREAGFEMPLMSIGVWSGKVFKDVIEEWCVESGGAKPLTFAYMMQLTRGVCKREKLLPVARKAYDDWVAACREADPSFTPPKGSSRCLLTHRV